MASAPDNGLVEGKPQVSGKGMERTAELTPDPSAGPGKAWSDGLHAVNQKPSWVPAMEEVGLTLSPYLDGELLDLP